MSKFLAMDREGTLNKDGNYGMTKQELHATMNELKAIMQSKQETFLNAKARQSHLFFERQQRLIDL